MSVRRQILDPLSTLCKIALLSFYDNGSRLSISDNIVEIQKSDNKQWIIRTYRRDNKDHISLLYNPILKAMQWYIFQQRKKSIDNNDNVDENDNQTDEGVNNSTKDNGNTLGIESGEVLSGEKDKAIKNIMKFAINGLKGLKVTYKEGNVILALQFLINNLKIATKDNPDIRLFEEYNEVIIIEEDGILNYDKIKELWDTDTIKSISNQFSLCEKNRSDPTTLEFMLESLNLMLKNTDNKFKKLVVEMNATL